MKHPAHSETKQAVLWRKRIILGIEIAICFLIYTVILLVIRNHIPDAPALIDQVKKVYGVYGYDLIFLGALLEGTFLVGFYVPGSFIVLLGAALSRSGVVSFPLVVLFGTLGLSLGYIVNYALGRFGWYRILSGFGFDKGIETAKDKLKHYQDRTIFYGYMMPSTASLLSTAAGIMKIPFKKFVVQSVLTQLFWSLLLGGLAYIFGMVFVEIFLQYFGFIALTGFVLWAIKKLREKEPLVRAKQPQLKKAEKK